jgi:hypothetical protein
MSLIQDVQPKRMISAYVEMPFDKGKIELEEAGYSLLSLEENVRLRIQEGRDKEVSKYGNRVREEFLYIPHKGKFFAKSSLIIANPAEVTIAHKGGSEFYLTKEQVEQSLVNSLQIKGDDCFVIPTNRFGEDEFAVYAFGNSAKDYGYFLRQEANIEEMPVWMVYDTGDKPFVRLAHFCGLSFDSSLDGGMKFCDHDRVRGVREVA